MNVWLVRQTSIIILLYPFHSKGVSSVKVYHPIALIFSKGTLANLQSVSIIAAFPIGIIIILVTISFFKDAKLFLKEQGYEDKTISAK